MKHSTHRILTTHVGSLARPADLLEMVRIKEAGQPYDHEAFAARVRTAVAEVVGKQINAGVDVVSDGEQGKPGFANYVKDRLTGLIARAGVPPRVSSDQADFPDFQPPEGGTLNTRRMVCIGPIGWKDRVAVQTDIDNFRAALQAVQGRHRGHVEVACEALGLAGEARPVHDHRVREVRAGRVARPGDPVASRVHQLSLKSRCARDAVAVEDEHRGLATCEHGLDPVARPRVPCGGLLLPGHGRLGHGGGIGCLVDLPREEVADEHEPDHGEDAELDRSNRRGDDCGRAPGQGGGELGGGMLHGRP